MYCVTCRVGLRSLAFRHALQAAAVTDDPAPLVTAFQRLLRALDGIQALGAAAELILDSSERLSLEDVTASRNALQQACLVRAAPREAAPWKHNAEAERFSLLKRWSHRRWARDSRLTPSCRSC